MPGAPPGSGNPNVAILALDASGSFEWAYSALRAKAVTPAANGDVVGGVHVDAQSSSVVRFDSAGNVVATRPLGDVALYAVANGPSGPIAELHANSSTDLGAGPMSGHVTAQLGSDLSFHYVGDELQGPWLGGRLPSRRMLPARTRARGSAGVADVAFDPSGRLYIAGTSDGSVDFGSSIYVAGANFSGGSLFAWTVPQPSLHALRLTSVVPSSRGRVIIAVAASHGPLDLGNGPLLPPNADDGLILAEIAP